MGKSRPVGASRTRFRYGSRLPAASRWLSLGAALLLGVCGCSSFGAHHGLPGLMGEDRWVAAWRPAWGDTTRMLHNAHYFKLVGQMELALKELEAAYQQEPHNLKVVSALANTYEEFGRFDQAQKLYQEALAQHRGNPALHNNLCFSYYLAGQWEQAEACFRQVLSRQPQNTAARNNLGLLLCRRGQFAEARRLWREGGGEALAQEMVTQALAALGIKESAVYAQQPPPGPAPPKPSVALTDPVENLGEVGPFMAKPEGLPPDATAAGTPAATRPRPDNRLDQTDKVAAVVEVRPKAAPPQSATPFSQEDLELAAAPRPPTPPGTGGSASIEPAAAPVPQAPKAPTMTAAELTDAAIEVRNGAGFPRLAAQTRTLLGRAGFQVARIGNHSNFKMEQTAIYYQPEAEKVAQALQAKFFPTSHIQEDAHLPPEVDVKVILGRALLEQPRWLDQLAAAQLEED